MQGSGGGVKGWEDPIEAEQAVEENEDRVLLERLRLAQVQAGVLFQHKGIHPLSAWTGDARHRWARC